MSRMIGNDARVGKYFIAPELGTKEEPCPLMHNSRDFITGVDPVGNYIIRDDTQSIDRISINKNTGVITFTPPLPGGGSSSGFTDYPLPGLVPGEYTLATLNATGVDYQAVGYYQLTSQTAGFKQEIYFCSTTMHRTATGQPQGDIYVIQNLTQSDTPPFVELKLREISPTEIELIVQVGVPCDANLRQIDATQGWVPPGAVVVAPTGTDYLTINTQSTLDSETSQTITAPIVKTGTTITNVVAPRTGLVISSPYEWNYGGQNQSDINIMQSLSVQTNILDSLLPQVQMGKNLSFSGGQEAQLLNVITQDPGVNLQLTEGLEVQGNIIMADNAITGLGNLTSGTSPNITVSGNFDMQTNDLLSAGNIYTNNIRKTGGSDIKFHDDVNFQNNAVGQVPLPTQNHHATNKQYVDALVGGGVQNPMTSDLDAGNFDITNITDLGADGTVNLTGTTTIDSTLGITATTEIRDTQVDWLRSGGIWLSTASATSTMRFTDGRGKLVLPNFTPGIISQVNTVFAQSSAGIDRLMYFGQQAGTGIGLEKIVMPSVEHTLACLDGNNPGEGGVTPNGGPTIWDSTNNGQEVLLTSWDVARQTGASFGAGTNGQVQTPYGGMITGLSLKNGGAVWNYIGGALITIKIGGAPVYTGTPLNGPPYFTIALPESRFFSVPPGTSFPRVTLEINTPNPGDQIDNFGSRPLQCNYTMIQDITN